jgi:hypothetical protein
VSYSNSHIFKILKPNAAEMLGEKKEKKKKKKKTNAEREKIEK